MLERVHGMTACNQTYKDRSKHVKMHLTNPKGKSGAKAKARP